MCIKMLRRSCSCVRFSYFRRHIFSLWFSLVIFIALVSLGNGGYSNWIILLNRQVSSIISQKKDSNETQHSLNFSNFSKEMRYILLWPEEDSAPLSFLGREQEKFIENNCFVNNCYVTSDRNYFKDITKFDAVAFNGRFLEQNRNSLPKRRSPHQLYIYFNMESAKNYLVNSVVFDSFFNLTATYRLDSDIPYPYILIRDDNGNKIGPKKDMIWNINASDDTVSLDVRNKNKAAAIFISNCKSKSKRLRLVHAIRDELLPYNLTLDIYGLCGQLKCPRNKDAECKAMLKRDYYFYLSFENSLDVDYVTEKLLTALQNNVVPIVYGGANYSRFLPPGSYLDARRQTPQGLASTMAQLISSPKLYSSYFRWKKYLTYYDPGLRENVCDVCAGINEFILSNTTKVYHEFRKWWNRNKS